MYVESSGTGGQPGNIQTGLAVSNTSSAAATVTFDLTQMDGSPAGLPPVSMTLQPFGQTAKFWANYFQAFQVRSKEYFA
jgi:hypothetical protein